MMTKQEQFLWAVQTAILANCVNVASYDQTEAGHAERYRHVISPTGILGMMHDVLWASERIPQDMTAAEAAVDFCGFMLGNLRDNEQAARDGRRPTVPYWFARS